MTYPQIKSWFERFVGFVGIIIFAPLIVIIAALVLYKMGRPVFFQQQRVGKDNKIFKIVKFRSMLAKSDERPTDAERLTSFGRFLRNASLDELPELWNVLRGEMNLIGPRPLLVEYVPLYTKEQVRRHEIKPGITGWAQVNGRNAINWEEKFQLDVWYVDNQSLRLDIKIMTLTLIKVFQRKDINAETEATMPAFKGSKK